MTRVLPSVCPLDCPDTCSLEVTVEDGRVIKVRGSAANPLTAGVLCNKVTHYYPEFVHGEDRLRHPLRRTGDRGEGRFEPISWDQALEAIHANFTAIIAEHGPEAILPLNYAGPHGMLAAGSMDQRFFHRLGASKLYRSSLCGGIRSEAWLGTFGAVPGLPPQQIEHSELIVVWGNNVTVTNLHLMPLINRAKRANGARVVVVDPKRIKLAEQADLHLAPHPGTDVVLAFAVACEIERTGGLDHDFIARHVHGFEPFMAEARTYPPERAAEVCGVPAEAICAFATAYGESAPAAIAIGNGLERNRNGGSGIRAVFALPALAGKFGRPGGGLVMGAGHAFPKTPARLTRPEFAPEGTRTLDILDLGRHLAEDDIDPPLRGLFIYNHNPVVVHPEQNRLRRALLREDVFIVGAEVAMTDSMAYCDIVLPACSHFEHDDIFASYGHQYLQRAEAVIPRLGEALPNTEIFRRLAAHFGFDEAAFAAADPELMDEAFDAGDPRMNGTPPSALPPGTALPMHFDGAEPVLFQNLVPATASGKVELASSYLAERHGEPLPAFRPLAADYPLSLITPASDKRITSTFGGLGPSAAAPPLEMHPDDARSRGLETGQWVRVWNERGEVRLRLEITEAVRQGCVYSDKGAWFRSGEGSQTVSALAPATKADLGGACFNDTRVEAATAAP
jgi:anaerobic selenocysteine-containing dehydrogenase